METVDALIDPGEIVDIRHAVQQVHVSEDVRRYVVSIVRRTRDHELVELGASPRSSQHLQRAAQGRAIMQRRTYVVPEDVMTMAPSVLAHRLIMSAESKMTGKSPLEIVQAVVSATEVPVGRK